MQRTEWLLSRPWLVVLVVALVVVLPVLVLGEASATDSRDRFRASQLDNLAKTADRAGAGISDVIESAKRQMLAGSATSVSGKPTTVLLALNAHDAAALGPFASYLGNVMTPQVLRIIVLDSAGRVAFLEPDSDKWRIGDDFSARELFSKVTTEAPQFVSGLYVTDGSRQTGGGGTSGATRAIGISSLVADARGAKVGVVLAELSAALLGRALTPSLSAADDVYVLDGDGLLVLRASHAFTTDPLVGQDLRAAPAGIAALGTATSVEAEDPLRGGTRLIGLGRVSSLGWHVLALRSPDVVERELDASLDQARLARLALAVVVLLGSVLFASTAARAIRQRHQLNESLQRNERLLADLEVTGRALATANRHKSEFLANMSHELRTPLNAIIGFADVLGQRMFGDLNERQAGYTEDIRSSGQHLLALINDILDLSKVEAGRMELTLADFSLRDALANGVTMIRERAAAHGITITFDAEDVGAISGDERKVRQVIFNLLSNAVKFTPDGGRIAVSGGRDSDHVTVRVQDTGTGIAIDDQQRIFDEFRQAKGGSSGGEGTGLGLSVTKALVELHHGRIWVDSEVGRGSTFSFTLPFAQPAPLAKS
jgi:signal transduction histidine kinase